MPKREQGCLLLIVRRNLVDSTCLCQKFSCCGYTWPGGGWEEFMQPDMCALTTVQHPVDGHPQTSSLFAIQPPDGPGKGTRRRARMP